MFWFIDNPEDTVQTATNKRSLPYCATVFMQYFFMNFINMDFRLHFVFILYL